MQHEEKESQQNEIEGSTTGVAHEQRRRSSIRGKFSVYQKHLKQTTREDAKTADLVPIYCPDMYGCNVTHHGRLVELLICSPVTGNGGSVASSET
jgi:hypothetical protein